MEPEKSGGIRKRVPLFNPDSPLDSVLKRAGLIMLTVMALPFLLTWPAVQLVQYSPESENIVSTIVLGGYAILAIWAVISIVRHLMRLNMKIWEILLYGLLILLMIAAFFFVSIIVSGLILVWRYGF